jgi:hypothetical protein
MLLLVKDATASAVFSSLTVGAVPAGLNAPPETVTWFVDVFTTVL